MKMEATVSLVTSLIAESDRIKEFVTVPVTREGKYGNYKWREYVFFNGEGFRKR